MKKIFSLLIILVSLKSFGQVYQVLPQYGYEMKRVDPTLVLKVPSDTTNNKTGIARIGTVLYSGNGTYWTAAGGGASGTDTSVVAAYGLTKNTLGNIISLKVDTALIATQYGVGAKLDTTKIYGEYLSTTFLGASLTSGFLKLDGSATITFNNPGITYTGGTGNKSDNYIRHTDTSSSNNYDYTWEFTLNTKFTDYTGQGKWFGKQSLDNTTIYNGLVYFGYGGSSSLARMKLALPSGTGNGTAVDSSSTISMADGYIYRLKFSQRQDVIYVKLSRLSSGTEVESVYINYRVSLAANNVLPNIGVAAFGSLDGTSEIKVTSFKVAYNDILAPDAVVIGTSISQGYRTTSMNNHYLEKAFKGSNHTFVNMGSGGLNFVDFLPLLPRAERLNPKYIIVEMGTNDNGLAVGSFRAYLKQIYDSVVISYGKQLVLIKDFANATYDTIYYNFAAQYGITLIDPAAVMTSTAYDPDLIHPNDLGFDIYATACKQAIPSLFGNQVVNDRYSLAGLSDVKLGIIANSDILSYNNTLGKWVNSAAASSPFVTLQTGVITNQTGGMGVTGYGQFGSGLAVGGANAGAEKLRVLGSTTQDVTSLFENSNSAGTFPYFRISQMGVTGYGVADWQSASVLTSFSSGGLILSSYDAGIKFQTGTSYTTRGTWNSAGLSIGTTAIADASAKLDVVSTTQGFLPPRMTATQGSAISSPAEGLLIYVTNTNGTFTSKGWWGWSGAAWEKLNN